MPLPGTRSFAGESRPATGHRPLPDYLLAEADLTDPVLHADALDLLRGRAALYEHRDDSRDALDIHAAAEAAEARDYVDSWKEK